MLLFLTLMAVAWSVPREDLVQSLPYLDPFPNDYGIYSGYIDASPSKHLHYMFIESSNDPSTDPIVVWYNGGPGCSSLDGLFYEHGPFFINEDGKSFTMNEHSWNQVANVLYIEAPIGVGFSYADMAQPYDMDDAKTAEDNANALESWFKKFPEYAGRDVFITGESYAGFYVPTLCLEIMRRGDDTTINLKGFGVGNGIVDYNMNDASLIFFAYYHGLVGQELWRNLADNCCGGTATEDTCDFAEGTSAMCQLWVNEVMEVVYSAGLNFYNLYGDCITTEQTRYERDLDLLLYHTKPEVKARWKKTHLEKTRAIGMNVPCIDTNGANVYLNMPTVQRALNIDPEHSVHWEICAGDQQLNYTRQIQNIHDTYILLQDEFMLRGVSYNGDTDMACNFLGVEWFINTLGLKSKGTGGYQPWSLPNNVQVAGFKEEFQYLTYYTVRGAGHMVPQWKPEEGLYILIDIISGGSEQKRKKMVNSIWKTTKVEL